MRLNFHWMMCACLTAVLQIPAHQAAAQATTPQPPATTPTTPMAPPSPTTPTTPGGSAAQPATPPPAAPFRASKWELEVHGGLSLDLDHSAGTASLPTTGATVQGLLSLATFTFGNATALFNQARPGSPITSLDPVVGASMVRRPAGLAGGARVYRAINPRLGIDVSGDFLLGDAAFRSSALNGLEATRASVATALQQTLAASGQTSSASAATTIVDQQRATRIVATGSLVVNLAKNTRTTPYVLVGGGLVFTQDSSINAQVNAQYQVGSSSYLTGYDRVWLRTTEDFRSITVVGGAGIKHALSRHTGFRVDGRVHVYPSSRRTLVSVTPAQAASSTAGSLPLFNYGGGLQFSGVSPLNAPPFSSTTSFSASGLQAQVTLTAGFVLRF